MQRSRREVFLLLSKDNEISDRRVSFVSNPPLEEREPNKAHDYITSLLVRFPHIVLGERKPSLVVSEVNIQETSLAGIYETRGAIDVMYLGLELRHINWGAFVEVKGSHEAEKEYNKFRKKGGSELPIRNAFRQIARHMHYISLMDGFDFSSGDFTYFLVFPKCPPNEIEEKIPQLLVEGLKPGSQAKLCEHLGELEGMLRLVEITEESVRFREALSSRSPKDLVVYENIRLRYHPRGLRIV